MLVRQPPHMAIWRFVVGGRAATIVAALALGACSLAPSATPSLNEKIAWTGSVFEAVDAAGVAELMAQDEARRLVTDYPQTAEIVAIHAGRLAPNISGPSFLGYVAEVRSVDGGDPMIILVNAETQDLAAAGLIPQSVYE